MKQWRALSALHDSLNMFAVFPNMCYVSIRLVPNRNIPSKLGQYDEYWCPGSLRHHQQLLFTTKDRCDLPRERISHNGARQSGNQQAKLLRKQGSRSPPGAHWALSVPGGPHVGPMNLTIRILLLLKSDRAFSKFHWISMIFCVYFWSSWSYLTVERDFASFTTSRFNNAHSCPIVVIVVRREKNSSTTDAKKWIREGIVCEPNVHPRLCFIKATFSLVASI